MDFTNILNKLYKQEWANIKEDLYSVVTFANNYNDVLVKNLLKVFLGKILQEEGNLSKALDIFNEQVAVFAKEKIALGALLCWYYIAKLTLVTEGSDNGSLILRKRRWMWPRIQRFPTTILWCCTKSLLLRFS